MPDRLAFKEESRHLFQELGWTIELGHNGGCDVVIKDQQDLYLHPTSFSGMMEENNIQPLQEQLLNTQAFRCYHMDRYEEYQDMSDEEYRAELEAKRDEITSYILERCRTKRRNLYIVAPVAGDVAAKFEICRLCDKNRRNRVGNRFMADLMDELLRKGWLVSAQTSHGEGIRTATDKERGARQPVTQVDDLSDYNLCLTGDGTSYEYRDPDDTPCAEKGGPEPPPASAEQANASKKKRRAKGQDR